MTVFNQNRIGVLGELNFAPAFLLLTLIALCISPSAIEAHELEDGFIEKTVAVVVRDHLATVEVSLGINPATMKQQLEKWQSESLQSELKAELPKQDLEKGQDPENAQTPESDLSKVEEIENAFRLYAFEQFAKELKVSLDGQSTKLSKVSVEQSSRHHFAMIAKYSFAIPKQQRVQLVIEDQTLKSMKGGSRYSLKTKGKSILFKSNVAPIIVRAKRNDLAKLAPEQLAQISRIEVSVGGTFESAEIINAAHGTDDVKN